MSPIITTASPQNFDLVKSLGATNPIDRHLAPSDIEKAIKEITSEPIKFVYDTVSLPATQNLGYGLLSSGGILVVFLSPKVDEEKKTPDKTIIGSHGTGYAAPNRSLCIDLYNHLTELLESGDIQVRAPKGV